MVSDVDNKRLIAMPTLSKVKQVVWDLSPTSAAGLDGFLRSFYRLFWNVIHMDVHKAVQEFFLGVCPPSQLTAAFITLIPKTENPQTFSEFRPICLTNFLAKVIT